MSSRKSCLSFHRASLLLQNDVMLPTFNLPPKPPKECFDSIDALRGVAALCSVLPPGSPPEAQPGCAALGKPFCVASEMR